MFILYDMGLMYKEYTYKIHDKDNVFKKTLLNSRLRDDSVSFARVINQWYWPVNLSYQVDHVDFDLDVFDTVYIYYGDVLVYRGYISAYNKVMKESKQYIDITIDGMQTLLKYCLYQYVSDETFLRTADPATIIAEVITILNNNRGWTIFNTTITAYWSNVSIAFDFDNGLSAINKVVSSVEHYIDFLPSGTIVFQAIDESIADHKLTFEKDITEFSRKVDSFNMANFVYVKHNAWLESSQDVTSQTDYGLLVYALKSIDINDDPTWVIRADKEIEDRKYPRAMTVLAVNDWYNLESLQLWDTVKILNKVDESATNFSSIQKIIYWENICTVYLQDYESIEKSLSQL